MRASDAVANDELDGFQLLRREVGVCQACVGAGLLSAAQPIPPGSRPVSPVMLIGQAPGIRSQEARAHFAGPGGRLLDRWLSQAGFPSGFLRSGLYLTSLTRCFPGKARSGSGDRPPSRREMQLCRPFLDRELALVKPSVILLIGKMAIDVFVDPRPLSESVGQVFRWREAYLVPLPHASGVSRWLNDPPNRVRLDTALDHLSRLRQELRLAPGSGSESAVGAPRTTTLA